MLVEKAIEGDSNFMKKRFSTQRDTIDKLAKEMMGEIKEVPEALKAAPIVTEIDNPQ